MLSVQSEYVPRFVLECTLAQEMSEQTIPIINSSAQIAAVFQEITKLKRELMIAGCIDCKCRLLHYAIISVGTTERLAMRVADAFTGAIQHSATGIFLVHNHPTGSLAPSSADINLTQDVASAGLILGLPLFDHVLVSSSGHCSLLSVSLLKRHGRQLAPATPRIRPDGGPLAIQWHCASCQRENYSYDGAAQAAVARRACVPLRCDDCQRFTWVYHAPRQSLKVIRKQLKVADRLVQTSTTLKAVGEAP